MDVKSCKFKLAPFAREGSALFNGRFIIVGIDSLDLKNLSEHSFTKKMLNFVTKSDGLHYIGESEWQILQQCLSTNFCKLFYSEDAWYVHELIHQKHLSGTYFVTYFYALSIAFRVLTLHSSVLNLTSRIIPYQQLEKALLLQIKLKIMLELVLFLSEQLACGFELHWGTMEDKQIEKSYGEMVLKGAMAVRVALQNGIDHNQCIKIFQKALNDNWNDILNFIDRQKLPYEFSNDELRKFKQFLFMKYQTYIQSNLKTKKTIEIPIMSIVSQSIPILIESLPPSSLLFFCQNYLVSDFCILNLLVPALNKSKTFSLLSNIYESTRLKFCSYNKMPNVDNPYQDYKIPMIFIPSFSLRNNTLETLRTAIYVETADVIGKGNYEIEGLLLKKYPTIELSKMDTILKIFIKITSVSLLLPNEEKKQFVTQEISNLINSFLWKKESEKAILSMCAIPQLDEFIQEATKYFSYQNNPKEKIELFFATFQKYQKIIESLSSDSFNVWENLFRFLHSHSV